MERIKEMRESALESSFCADKFYYLYYQSFKQSGHTSKFLKHSEALYYAFENLAPSITENELIVGKYITPLTDEEKLDWEKNYLELAAENFPGQGQDSHMAIDYELVLKCGLYGIIEKIDGYIKSRPEKADFYNSCRQCLLGVIRHSENYADAALELAKKEKNEKRKNELIKISEVCRNVPAYPAKSFYEAVQAVHFITYCITYYPQRRNPTLFQLGHPDRYLLPYYLSDIEKGIITKEYAQLLLDCLGIQMNVRTPRGLSVGYMVGGRECDGSVVQNELTHMCMQVVDDIHLIYPAVGLCYTSEMDDEYLENACRILLKGRSHPAIFNDDVISKGLRHYGVPQDEAHSYIHSTCVEITPVASSNVWVACPYTNMAQLLLDIMDREYVSFDELFSAFFAKLDAAIKANFEKCNELRFIRSQRGINPLLSCLVNDCLERGEDIENGGARYNWIMPSFVGIANVVDSLYAIRELVFEKGELTIGEFSRILDKNFEGHEELHQYIQNKIPKYGNDIDDVDRLFGIITEHIICECENYTAILPNGKLIPSAFCWINHERMGTATGATPDGRCASFPLGDGSGPCQGREMNGPTASVLSSTKWEHYKMIGGIAVNMKFSKAFLGEKSNSIMTSIIKTFMSRGGFEMQINVTDKETLEKALKNPDAYKDLVVRIGGYSDYFTKLSPEMQQEVIKRTEHRI